MPQVILQRGDPWSYPLQEVRSKLKDQGFFPTIDLTGKFGAVTEDAVIYFQQTHLGPSKRSLQVTGIVNDSTMWAVKHPTGSAQKSSLVPQVPRGITGMRKQVLETALVEHAKKVKERPNGSNRSKDIDKYLPGWQRKKLTRYERGPAWCAYFVNWVITQEMTRPWGGYYGSCSKLVSVCETKGLEVYTPADIEEGTHDVYPGDLFFVLHPKKPGKAQTGHVGIVFRVNRHQTKITTLEGNCGNRVKCGEREVSTLTKFVDFYDPSDRPTNFVRTLAKVASVSGAGTR